MFNMFFFLLWIYCLIILNYILYSIPSDVLLLNQITHSYKCRIKQKNETNAHNTMGPANYCLQLIAVSNTLLCPAIYCVKPNTVSTLLFNVLNVLLSTCCGRIMLRSLYSVFINDWQKCVGSNLKNISEDVENCHLNNYILSMECPSSTFRSPNWFVDKNKI